MADIEKVSGIDEVIEHLSDRHGRGGVARLAELMDITHEAARKWQRKGSVPIRRVLDVQQKLRVSCPELRSFDARELCPSFPEVQQSDAAA